MQDSTNKRRSGRPSGGTEWNIFSIINLPRTWNTFTNHQICIKSLLVIFQNYCIITLVTAANNRVLWLFWNNCSTYDGVTSEEQFSELACVRTAMVPVDDCLGGWYDVCLNMTGTWCCTHVLCSVHITATWLNLFISVLFN